MVPISYLEALELLDSCANRLSKRFCEDEELVRLLDSVGRVGTRRLQCPVSVPPFDTSAMDGYALQSELTLSASPTNPVVFEVRGTSAAGDQPIRISSSESSDIPSCVEIMTGAQFPTASDNCQMDACVPVELTERVEILGRNNPCIQIKHPVHSNQHRRFAASDIVSGEDLLRPLSVIEHQHIMALASAGIKELMVLRKVRISVYTTGSEIVAFDSPDCSSSQIRDSNGPYIKKTLETMALAADVQHHSVADDLDSIRYMLRDFQRGKQDVLVTTGGVSAGRFDLIRESLERQGFSIRFHKVAVRPGHPVLFATMDDQRSINCTNETTDATLNGQPSEASQAKAIFGLPGNPVAAAACLQFFVVPFLKRVTCQPSPTPIPACLNSSSQAVDLGKSRDHPVDVFRHGTLHMAKTGPKVTLAIDQASYKVSPISQSNCWVWIPASQRSLTAQDVLPCFPFVSGHGTFTSFPDDISFAEKTEAKPRGTFGYCSKGKVDNPKVLLLAGGVSTRMGSPKHLLLVKQDIPLYQDILQHVQYALGDLPHEDVYISMRSAANAQHLKQFHNLRNVGPLPYNTLIDTPWHSTETGHEIGPASGLLTAYNKHNFSDWLVIASDYPLLDADAIHQLLNEHNQPLGDGSRSAVSCFINNDGFVEPLLGIWGPAALQRLQQYARMGIYGPSKTVNEMAKEGKAKLVKPLKDTWILGANTPQEWERCMQLMVQS